MLAMSHYGEQDYDAAAETFRKYFQSYPQGEYAEMASFYIGQSIFMGTPELASTNRQQLQPLLHSKNTLIFIMMPS